MIRLICARCDRTLTGYTAASGIIVAPCPVCVGSEEQTSAVIDGLQDRLDRAEDQIQHLNEVISNLSG